MQRDFPRLPSAPINGEASPKRRNLLLDTSLGSHLKRTTSTEQMPACE
jgi:hypothetical protein